MVPGRTNQNEMEGKGYNKPVFTSAVSPMLQTFGNIPDFQFYVRDGFVRGGYIRADEREIREMNYRSMGFAGHVQQGYHENRPTESRSWWLGPENMNQSRGRGTRGERGPRRSGRRGRR